MAITSPARPGIGSTPHPVLIEAEAGAGEDVAPRPTLETEAGPGPARPQGAVERQSGEDVIRDLVAAQEVERRRIAREIHDVVGQALTAVKINLDTLHRTADGSATQAVLSHSIAIVDEAMRDVRDLAFDLRPAILDDLGLVAAASWYVARQARLVGYESRFQAIQIRRTVGVEIEAACFRTLQEALTNVARHARAANVAVELLQTPDELVLTIEDDGVGFDVRRTRRQNGRRPTLGLLGLAERVGLVGGSMDITSRPGGGTKVRARFPRRVTNRSAGR